MSEEVSRLRGLVARLQAAQESAELRTPIPTSPPRAPIATTKMENGHERSSVSVSSSVSAFEESGEEHRIPSEERREKDLSQPVKVSGVRNGDQVVNV